MTTSVRQLIGLDICHHLTATHIDFKVSQLVFYSGYTDFNSKIYLICMYTVSHLIAHKDKLSFENRNRYFNIVSKLHSLFLNYKLSFNYVIYNYKDYYAPTYVEYKLLSGSLVCVVRGL